jgi:hypothetical protein
MINAREIVDGDWPREAPRVRAAAERKSVRFVELHMAIAPTRLDHSPPPSIQQHRPRNEGHQSEDATDCAEARRHAWRNWLRVGRSRWLWRCRQPGWTRWQIRREGRRSGMAVAAVSTGHWVHRAIFPSALTGCDSSDLLARRVDEAAAGQGSLLQVASATTREL